MSKNNPKSMPPVAISWIVLRGWRLPRAAQIFKQLNSLVERPRNDRRRQAPTAKPNSATMAGYQRLAR